jgi:hypothetical protein
LLGGFRRLEQSDPLRMIALKRIMTKHVCLLIEVQILGIGQNNQCGFNIVQNHRLAQAGMLPKID